MNTNVEIGGRIRLARERLHLSQEFIAAQIGMNRTSFVHLEAGDRKVTAEEVLEISRVLGLTATEILDGRSTDAANTTVFARAFGELSAQDQKEVLNMIEFKKSLMARKTR